MAGGSKRFGEGAGFNPSHARITPPTSAGVPAELEEGEKAPSRAQGGQNKSWERAQPTQGAAEVQNTALITCGRLKKLPQHH